MPKKTSTELKNIRNAREAQQMTAIAAAINCSLEDLKAFKRVVGFNPKLIAGNGELLTALKDAVKELTDNPMQDAAGRAFKCAACACAHPTEWCTFKVTMRHKLLADRKQVWREVKPRL